MGAHGIPLPKIGQSEMFRGASEVTWFGLREPQRFQRWWKAVNVRSTWTLRSCLRLFDKWTGKQRRKTEELNQLTLMNLLWNVVYVRMDNLELPQSSSQCSIAKEILTWLHLNGIPSVHNLQKHQSLKCFCLWMFVIQDHSQNEQRHVFPGVLYLFRDQRTTPVKSVHVLQMEVIVQKNWTFIYIDCGVYLWWAEVVVRIQQLSEALSRQVVMVYQQILDSKLASSSCFWTDPFWILLCCCWKVVLKFPKHSVLSSLDLNCHLPLPSNPVDSTNVDHIAASATKS